MPHPLNDKDVIEMGKDPSSTKPAIYKFRYFRCAKVQYPKKRAGCDEESTVDTNNVNSDEDDEPLPSTSSGIFKVPRTKLKSRPGHSPTTLLRQKLAEQERLLKERMAAAESEMEKRVKEMEAMLEEKEKQAEQCRLMEQLKIEKETMQAELQQREVCINTTK